MSLFSWLGGLFKKKEVAPSAPPTQPTGPTTPSTPTPSPPSVAPSPGSKPVTRPSDLPAGNHYGSRNRLLMEAEYTYLWPMASIRADWRIAVQAVVAWAIENRSTFLAASKETAVPWWVIAGINNLEMGANFNGTILNGDSWKSKTKHYPPGLGPWKSWLEACVWGLRYEAKGWGFDLAKYRWNVGGAFYFAESYNGHNVREAIGQSTVPPHASPYIYSGTPFYVSGKMTEVETAPGSGKYRGVFDSRLVSEQVGFMAFAKGLELTGEKLF